MTRQEQLQQRVAKQQERLAKERQEMLAAEGALRTEERRLLNKRRYHVGALADEAGILDQETATLVEGFALLARLLEQGALREVLAIYPPEDGQGVPFLVGDITSEEVEEAARVSEGK